jgi:hypothetical protein
MHVRTLATISADGNTDVEIPMKGYRYHPEAVLQIDITGTITIQVLGSLDGTSYVEMMGADTADRLQPIAAVPYLRFTATSTSGGTAVVKIMVGQNPRE